MREISSGNQYHTIVVSDLHLSDAEPKHKQRPLWKKFRQSQFFIDQDFADFLEHLCQSITKPIELVLNGDIFDFDSVVSIPTGNHVTMTRFERRMGLDSEEEKSVFKLGRILEDHHVWIRAISDFLLQGNRVVFVIGNHDLELHWPKAQEKLLNMLKLPKMFSPDLRFCEWFYISGGDTLIEHGNQYDPYCLCSDPINPLVKSGKRTLVRLPFGNLANKYMVNGMGLKNPHSDANFIMGISQYVLFFLKYEFRLQPFMALTWFTGAIRTFLVYYMEGQKRPLNDPLMFKQKLNYLALKSQATPEQALLLRGYHARAAVHNPWMVLRELWLDRAFLLLLIILGSSYVFMTMHYLIEASFWWFLSPLAILSVFYFLYASKVTSDVKKHANKALRIVPFAARALGIKRVVHGHTHRIMEEDFEGVNYYNTGSWSPLFKDVECTQEYGHKAFVSINSDGEKERRSHLLEWKNGKVVSYYQQKVFDLSHESKMVYQKSDAVI